MRKPLLFSGTATHPDQLKWSKDNHLSLLSSQYIRIMTPSLGVRFENEHVTGWTKSTIDASIEAIDPNPFPELKKRKLKNSVEIRLADKSDVIFKQCCWSPLGTSLLGGCSLAVLTSSFQVLIYEPPTDPSLNRWTLRMDLSSSITKEFQKDDLDQYEVTGEIY